MTWNYKNQQAGITSYVDKGRDTAGVSYAYNGWPDGTDIYFNYSGYIRVPGEPGTKVTCNWMTSIARGAKVTIGGVVCCQFSDNKNEKDGITVGYDRLAMYKPVTLTAGWQKIDVYMGNWWNTTRGPQANTKNGWTSNFAIGVDWQARCATNTAYYAKLLDPGDGSFIRIGAPDQQLETRIQYANECRANFSGNVGFGAGATLDLNDPEKNFPMNVATVAGVPTVKNGRLVVGSSTWLLRKSDLLTAGNAAKGQPMSFGANGEIVFPDGAITIDATDAEAEAFMRTHKTRTCPIVADVTAFPNNTFALSEKLKATGWFLQRTGNALNLCCSTGVMILLR